MKKRKIVMNLEKEYKTKAKYVVTINNIPVIFRIPRYIIDSKEGFGEFPNTIRVTIEEV